jgi:hypothetical protein
MLAVVGMLHADVLSHGFLARLADKKTVIIPNH